MISFPLSHRAGMRHVAIVFMARCRLMFVLWLLVLAGREAFAGPADPPPSKLSDLIVRSTLALTNGQSPPPAQGPAYNAFSSEMLLSFGQPPPDPAWTNWVYTRNTNFWLNGVAGLDALNVFPYQMQLTLVTPRHCLTVEHMRGCGSNYMVCFVGTNNTAYWRRSLGTIEIPGHLRACILDAAVPITPMTLISSATLSNQPGLLPARTDPDAGKRTLPMIFFNQRWQAWVGDAVVVGDYYVAHNTRSRWLNEWSWAVPDPPIVGGDSGGARCLVIGRQLYLLGLAQSTMSEGTMQDIAAINASLDKLSDQTGQPHNHVTVFDASRYPKE